MTEVKDSERNRNKIFDILLSNLPWHLRCTRFWPKAEPVLRRACTRGYIAMGDEGSLQWVYGDGNKTSLSYLVGRLYCGDSPRGSYWKKGQGHLPFPSKDVCQVFGQGMRNLASLRANRITLPSDHLDIDMLFK